jgi:hypothetical protein
VAAPGILAVTADRKICLFAEGSKERDDTLRLGPSHFAEVPLLEGGPTRVRPRLRLRIRDQLAAGRDFRHPDVEEILTRVILFFDATRQQPYGTEAKPFAARSGRADANDSYCHKNSSFSLDSDPEPESQSRPAAIFDSTVRIISAVTSSGRRAPSMRQ